MNGLINTVHGVKPISPMKVMEIIKEIYNGYNNNFEVGWDMHECYDIMELMLKKTDEIINDEIISEHYQFKNIPLNEDSYDMIEIKAHIVGDNSDMKYYNTIFNWTLFNGWYIGFVFNIDNELIFFKHREPQNDVEKKFYFKFKFKLH